MTDGCRDEWIGRMDGVGGVGGVGGEGDGDRSPSLRETGFPP